MKHFKWLVIAAGVILLSGFAPRSGSCRRPLPWHKQECQAMEQAILDATVRLVFHGWIEVENGYEMERIYGTISHATVIDGRYLITHNHFGIPLSQIQLYNRYANASFTGVSVYRLDGTAVVDYAPLDIFEVVYEKGETALLDFGAAAGKGFFSQAGVGSAKRAGADEPPPVPGAEVAQVDWDGLDQTRVVWVQIKQINQRDGSPEAWINHVLELGASGGGVFLNGRHIGNNRGNLIETNTNSGAVKKRFSLVALN